MVRLDELAPAPGSKKERKIVGRGNGSGHGGRAGRGDKGQKARSGMTRRPAFEGGGVMPSLLRLPHKRGFTNIFRQAYSPVNVGDLNVFADGGEVTPEKLIKMKLVSSPDMPVKILGSGDLKRRLSVKANAFSARAKAQIESAGGSVEVIGHASETD
ncbi:MAG: 50S ribosomal protein L15 [Chloroflexota bacterium]